MSAIAEEPKAPSDAVDLSRTFQALANDDRLALLRALLLQDVEDGAARSIAGLAAQTDLSRFSASRHLSILRDAGVVVVRRSGHRKLHYLNSRHFTHLEDWLYPFTDAESQLR